jgi:hypothetical protein
MYQRVFSDERLPRTIVVVPSLSLSESELAKLDGVLHYEERMLCLLLLLRMPQTRIIYVTSLALDPAVLDYHLGLIADVEDAAERLTLIDLADPSLEPLTAKLLRRHDAMTEIRSTIDDPASAHLSCFAATGLERTLAVQLGIPMYAPDPDLWHLGTKSEGRRVFRSALVDVPDGFEDVTSEDLTIGALADLWRRQIRRAVVKLDEGFSGEGNAVIDLTDVGGDPVLWLSSELSRRLEFEASGESWASYEAKLRQMGGVVEAFIEGEEVRSPSVQCRITPVGETVIISTHDQILGGRHGQVYLGCRFPSDAGYRRTITDAARRVADVLARHGVIGRFGIDFLTVRRPGGWEVYGLEINLRKGGTTLPFLMLDYLSGGSYDTEAGEYMVPGVGGRAYVASDNVLSPHLVGAEPTDLVRLLSPILFNPIRKTGIVLHLLGAVRRHGKFGMVAIDRDVAAAQALFDQAVSALDRFVPVQMFG